MLLKIGGNQFCSMLKFSKLHEQAGRVLPFLIETYHPVPVIVKMADCVTVIRPTRLPELLG